MSFSTWLNKQFLPSGAEELQQEVAAKQKLRTEDQYARGQINMDKRDRLLADIAGTNYDTVMSQVSITPLDDFQTGAKEGLKNVVDTSNKLTGNLVSGVVGSINWKVWLIAGIVIAVYFGLHRPIIAKLGGKA